MISPAQARDKHSAAEGFRKLAALKEGEQHLDEQLSGGLRSFEFNYLNSWRPYLDDLAAMYRQEGWSVMVSGASMFFSEPPAEGNDR